MPSSNPFNDFQFGSEQLPRTNSDNLLELLKTGPANTAYNHDPVQVEGGTSAGIKRVNDNMADNGVVAFKDKNGRAVLTNVARDPLSNKEVKLGEGSVAQQHNATSQIVQEQQPTIIGETAVSLDISKTFDLLKKSTNLGEARSLYNSIQQSLTEQTAKINKDAFVFAENKLGLPELEKQLELTRQTDRASIGWYPGIGDSPVTQKVVAQIATLRNLADNEAKSFLSSNPTALRLMQFSKAVETEMKRIETNEELRIRKKEAVDLARETSAINRTEQARLRNEERQDRIDDQFVSVYDSMSSAQRSRIELLAQDDILRIEQEFPTDPTNPSANPENERKKKIRIAQLIKGQEKNKPFQEAINAQGTADLMGLAITGNQWARKALLHEESKNTGMSVQELDRILTESEKAFMSRGDMQRMLIKREGPERGKTLMAQLMMDTKSYEPEKSKAAARTKALLMLDWMSEQKTAAFIDNVETWKSIDPLLHAAIAKSKEVSKNSRIDNVFTAYVGNSDGDERRKKIAEFQSLIRSAVAKHSKSQFGVPDEMALNSAITAIVLEKGIMRKLLEGQYGQLTPGMTLSRFGANLFGLGFDRASAEE